MIEDLSADHVEHHVERKPIDRGKAVTRDDRLHRPRYQHVSDANCGTALVVGHFAVASWGQLSRVCQGSSRIKASKAPDHALGAGAAYPITKPSRSLPISGWRK